jgi:hypothetical protein
MEIISMSATMYVKNENVPVRHQPYTASMIFGRRLNKGTAIVVIGSAKNAHGDLWYMIDGKLWIHSDDLSHESSVCTNHSYNSNGFCSRCNAEFPLNITSMHADVYHARNISYVRERPYSSGNILRVISRDEIITVIGSARNSAGTIWYLLIDGAWINSNDFTQFIPVENIINVPMTAIIGTPLVLTGTVSPANATNKTIAWSIVDARGTGAFINNGILHTQFVGTVTVRATISNGAAHGDYTQLFNITVSSEPRYGITFDSDNKIFTSAHEGYTTQIAHTVTIYNSGDQPTGTLSISLIGTNASSFELNRTTISNIGINVNEHFAFFTVRPRTGLIVGTYTATVVVSGGNGISKSFNVSFTVTANTIQQTLPNVCNHTFNNNGYCSRASCSAEFPIILTSLNTIMYVINNNDPVRSRPYQENNNIVRRLSRGTAVTVIGSGRNSVGNLWYKLSCGNWIYSGNVSQR